MISARRLHKRSAGGHFPKRISDHLGEKGGASCVFGFARSPIGLRGRIVRPTMDTAASNREHPRCRHSPSDFGGDIAPERTRTTRVACEEQPGVESLMRTWDAHDVGRTASRAPSRARSARPRPSAFGATGLFGGSSGMPSSPPGSPGGLKRAATGLSTGLFGISDFHLPEALVGDDVIALLESEETHTAALRSCIVLPNNPYRIVWDWFLVVFVLWTCFTVPVQICFASSVSDFDVIDLLIDIFFICDLVLNFRTAYDASDGTFVRDPWKISRKYLTSWFVIDLLASVPFDRIPGLGGDTDENLILSMAKVPRLLRISRLLKKLEVLTTARAMRMVSVMVIFLSFTHFVGCFWWLVGRLMGPQGWQFQPDIVPLLLQDIDWTDADVSGRLATLEDVLLRPSADGDAPDWLPTQYNASAVLEVYQQHVGVAKCYVTSLYWALTMVMKSPWLPPRSTGEQIFACIIVFFAAGMFAYCAPRPPRNPPRPASPCGCIVRLSLGLQAALRHEDNPTLTCRARCGYAHSPRQRHHDHSVVREGECILPRPDECRQLVHRAAPDVTPRAPSHRHVHRRVLQGTHRRRRAEEDRRWTTRAPPPSGTPGDAPLPHLRELPVDARVHVHWLHVLPRAAPTRGVPQGRLPHPRRLRGRHLVHPT